MHFRQQIGRWGENLACKYLTESSYEILERNFWCSQGEVDIIAKDVNRDEFVFIEVKTRSNLKYGNPADAVNHQKQKHIKQVVKYYLYEKCIENMAIRVDVVEVYIEKQNYRINHIKQVF